MDKDVEPPDTPLAPLDFGPLCVDKVNNALGLRLMAGRVHFSVRAQLHARDRHPEEFTDCLGHIGRIVRTPDYVGQGPGQSDGFGLVGAADDGRAIVLVAIKLRRDVQGRYVVASTYLIDRNKLERRVRKGFLKAV